MTTNTNRNAVSRRAAMDFILATYGKEIEAINPDVFKALNDWSNALNKKRTNNEPTKEQIANMALLEEVVQFMAASDKPVTARDVLNNVDGVMTIQKASAILRKGVQTGRIIANVDKKTTEYTLA